MKTVELQIMSSSTRRKLIWFRQCQFYFLSLLTTKYW